MRVVALDPGETSGVAWIDLAGKDLREPIHKYVARMAEWTEVVGLANSENEAAMAIYRIIEWWEADVLVCESFRVRVGETSADPRALSPVRINAKVGLAVSLYKPGVQIVEQSASQAKGVITDERLKRWGLWVEGHKDARDALRHLVVFGRSRLS